MLIYDGVSFVKIQLEYLVCVEISPVEERRVVAGVWQEMCETAAVFVINLSESSC